MTSQSTTRLAGLSLMAGVALVFVVLIASFFAGGGSGGSIDQSDFAAALAELAERDSFTHATGMLLMLSSILMAFGVFSLLRLRRDGGRADLALRFGVGMAIFAWGVYIVELSMRQMAVQVVTRGVGTGMDATSRDELGLMIVSAMVGVHYAFIALGAVSSVLIGLGIGIRFHELNLYVIAGYGFAAKGVAEIINLALIQHLQGADFGILISASNVLVFLGAIWLFIIGYGIFHGERELVPEEEWAQSG